MVKKLFKRSLISLSTIFITLNANATSYQIFSGLNFYNPAAINVVKKEELVVGGTGLFNRFYFRGTAAGVNGSATSDTEDFLGYGRIAHRFSPRVVASFDVTQPYYTNIQYPTNSIVNLFATTTIIKVVNYSPKVSFQVNDKLAVGVGFDASHFYNGQLSFVIPPLGELSNRATSWGYGWDIGLWYALRTSTFLSLAYYSKIVQHAKGVSTWGPLTNNALSADLKLPATFVLNVIQMLSPLWALSATVRYSQWNTLRATVLQNTALGVPITVPANFYNNVSTELATRYQVNSKWAILGAFDYEPNVQPTYTRNVGLPTYTRLIPAAGAEYEMLKGLKAKLIYAYAYSRPPIAMSVPPGISIQGRESVNVNAVDLSFTYDI